MEFSDSWSWLVELISVLWLGLPVWLKLILDYRGRSADRRPRRREEPLMREAFDVPQVPSTLSYYDAKHELDRQYWYDDNFSRKSSPPRDMMDRNDDNRY